MFNSVMKKFMVQFMINMLQIIHTGTVVWGVGWYFGGTPQKTGDTYSILPNTHNAIT